ncbi:MAG: hypothetical protein KatS3mg110_4330 [Pirellulaceae bacterium]|nr:MAG: hypothetical protein KatS3mg110_4330 [Pirellulaceae bacterium]
MARLWVSLALLVGAWFVSDVLRADERDWESHPENCWILQSPREGAPAPPVGWEGSGSYDPYSRLWLHWGGHDGIPQGFALFTFDLDSGKWQQRFPNTSPPGVCCVDGANVFDLANRRFVRFPGASLGHGYQWSRGVKLKNSAVWLYDPGSNQWVNMRPPPYALSHSRDGLGQLNAGATYDPNHELAISFGGQTSAGDTNRLFVYDAYANRLAQLRAENPPPPRDGMGICYDAANECLVVFGSQYGNDERTWIYRYHTNRWEAHDLQPRPPGKKLGTYSTIPKMAYDSLNNVCLCVTWDTNTNEHQTWVLDVAKLQWTKMNPAVEPAPSMSRSRNLSFDAARNVFILETVPKENRGTGVQIWTYRFRKAAPTRPLPPPTDVQVLTDSARSTVTWTTVPGAHQYHVYRAEGDEPWKLQYERIATVDQPRYEDSGLIAGKVYFYKIAAIGDGGKESRLSFSARTQLRALLRPVVSVVAPDKVEVHWNPHPAPDTIGYHVYRGEAVVQSVRKGTPGPWKDNDPEYPEPVPVEVRDIVDLRRLTDQPIRETTFVDHVPMTRSERAEDEYRYHVYAYVVRAVNRLGTESGPSPYALTIPSEPMNLFIREQPGGAAELRWDASAEKGVVGYHVYKLDGTWQIMRLTDHPIRQTRYVHTGGAGVSRYWVVAVDVLGQQGQPSSPVWYNRSYRGFYEGEWHQ